MAVTKTFNLRKFISLYMTLSFIVMIVSGIILYIAPSGRIAHWSYWSTFGLTKTEWQNIHIIFTFLFVIAGLLHIRYNLKPIIHYLTAKSVGNKSISKELIYSIIFSIFVFVGTYLQIQPFSFVLELGEEITESWENESTEPPMPHAERLTMVEFASLIDMKTNGLINKLSKNGYVVKDSLTTMEELASKYNTTPSVIYKAVNAKVINESISPNNSFAQGSGFGRKNLSEVLSGNNISWDDGIALLKKNGIIVEKDMRLKDIAEENKASPIGIINALGLTK